MFRKMAVFLFLFFPIHIISFAQEEPQQNESKTPVVIDFQLAQESIQASNSEPIAFGDDVEIIGAEFGILKKIEGNRFQFVPASKVPLIEGQEFGWAMWLKKPEDKIEWKEELELPKMPLSWELSKDPTQPKQTISADQKTSTTIRESRIDHGFIWNFWGIAFGDPAGEYKIRLYIKDKLVREFKFTCTEE